MTDRNQSHSTEATQDSEKPFRHLPALAYPQKEGRTLYAFTVPGRALSSFVTVSRLQRGEQAGVEGYQRPEVLAHIDEIRTYLETDAAMLPNALVVAFDDRVRFDSLSGTAGDGAATRHGELVVPTGSGEADKPGWVVDGQQRMAALRHAEVEDFHVCVVGFVAESIQEQREQFMLVNATKPLPKSLIYELLPATDCRLPASLEGRQLPAKILERLNFDEDSPLALRIKTHTNPDGDIKDNSVLQMIENSLSDGVLYRYCDRRSGSLDLDEIVHVLKAFWGAVGEVFPRAWSLPPGRSRLTHGAGIVSMGYVMDAIADRYRREGPPAQEHFENDLKQLAPACHWTKGRWDMGAGVQRRWNEIQNTSQDRRLLTNYLMIQYRKRVAV
jgi:DGQHR domain-containing protein